MRRKLCVSMIIAATVVALLIGIADIVGETDLLCSASTCLKVHSSSFATSFVIPLGFYAAAFLCLVLVLYLKGKKEAALLILFALMGFEAYLTFIQVVFIHSLCTSCIVFFTMLLASCTVATRGHVQGGSKNPVLVGFFMFFVAHFAFFFPNVELRPNLTQLSHGSKKIEIFASPSCSHCEEALADLRSLASHGDVELVVRPVSISRNDVTRTVRWVCQKLFRCPSVTAQKLAEKIVWENQEEARKLNNGTLAVPIVVVSSGGHRRVIRGWGPEASQLVREELAAQSGLSQAWAAGENTAHFFAGGEENHVCSTGNACGSATGIADN
ncbi:MAG: hypothetical protein JRJ75_13760 [Deltaproteobacteria bacterium]|nr:hypothetical protein [Deltaproteobacteria bacterium]